MGTSCSIQPEEADDTDAARPAALLCLTEPARLSLECMHKEVVPGRGMTRMKLSSMQDMQSERIDEWSGPDARGNKGRGNLLSACSMDADSQIGRRVPDQHFQPKFVADTAEGGEIVADRSRPGCDNVGGGTMDIEVEHDERICFRDSNKATSLSVESNTAGMTVVAAMDVEGGSTSGRYI
eukprot:TRINITY_DN80556_c0_g1_i1.p2 TRINITY_DN80556_c0_g1~~TRINITY_DN80556_c0_g1_i1.p2  ORF type:complete len:181 (+),score=32.85 TRINITY_DN80556_c0_g1_i1:99-641(+)